MAKYNMTGKGFYIDQQRLFGESGIYHAFFGHRLTMAQNRTKRYINQLLCKFYNVK